MYREVALLSNSTETFKGILMNKFVVPSVGLQNSTVYPPNAAYYQFGKSGVSNLTSCQHGAPICMSKPHFLDADTFYTERIIGLNPNPEIHNTFVDVEPHLGTEMHAAKRVQIVVEMANEPLLYPNLLVDLFMPVVWIEQSGHMTDAQADHFKSTVYVMVDLMYYLRIVCMPVGSFIVLVGVALAIKTLKIYKNRSPYQPIPERIINTATENFQSM